MSSKHKEMSRLPTEAFLIFELIVKLIARRLGYGQRRPPLPVTDLFVEFDQGVPQTPCLFMQVV
jgi:hypothetical protein